MDPGPAAGCSLKDVKWSAAAAPLDLLLSTYRLPQLARLDSGEWAPPGNFCRSPLLASPRRLVSSALRAPPRAEGPRPAASALQPGLPCGCPKLGLGFSKSGNSLLLSPSLLFLSALPPHPGWGCRH